MVVNEIMRLICLYSNRRSLSRLARTCKNLHDPAIQALWSDLNSLVPLVLCLPAECITVQVGAHGRKTVVMTLPSEAGSVSHLLIAPSTYAAGCAQSN